jgi:hypothetical protein
MPAIDIDLVQHVRILGVEVEQGRLTVDIYGGDERTCGTVVYHFEDDAELRKHAKTLRRWEAKGTDVTYLRRGETVMLLDEVAYLADAFARSA